MQAGEKLGRYEIRKKIGAGGMGEVYLAHDGQLDRLVALKILPPDISADENREKRFKQEARAASALNHPNIITIYEIGESEGRHFIATEYIEGETLRDVLKRSPLKISRAVKIAEQIANALTVAHEARIIHRDIKPENVMIRRDGYVKILDFGLAKPTAVKNESSSEDVTKQILMTTPGLIMGSVRYMSPEQARGVAVDERTDIWSLGAVLYEMVTGKSPFDAETTSDTIAAVIYKEPEPLVNLVPGAPSELQRIIRKSLKKQRDERYQNIKDLALDLKNLLYEIEHEISLEGDTRAFHITNSSGGNVISSREMQARQTSGAIRQTGSGEGIQTSGIENAPERKTNAGWLTAAGIVGAIILLGAISFGAYRWYSKKSNSVAAAFDKTQSSRLTSDGKAVLPAMSPDGKYVAYVSGEIGNRGLFVRQIATESVVPLVPPSPLGFKAVNFSPDGNYVYYTQTSADFTINTLYQIPTLGGTPKKIVEDVDSTIGFSPDGKRLVFMRQASKDDTDQLFTANIDGSNLQMLTDSRKSGFNDFSYPDWSPDGAKILIGAYKTLGGNKAEAVIIEISATDGSARTVSEKKWEHVGNISWLKDGSGFLMTAREPEAMATQIWRMSYPDGELHQITNDLNSYGGLAISSDGKSLVTVQGNAVASVWGYTPATKEQIQLTPDSPGLDGDWGISQSPDGKIIFTRKSGRDCNIWMLDADGKNPQQLTSNARINNNPVATPDGRYIIFVSNRSGSWRVWRMDTDGKNPVQLSDGNADFEDFSPRIMPDSRTVIFQRINSGGNEGTVVKVSIDGGALTPLISDENFVYDQPIPSPDGKLIVFRRFNPETYEKKLFVAEFDGSSIGKTRKTLSPDFISLYFWSPDNKSITYINAEGIANLWRLPLDDTPPQPLTDFKSGRIHSFSWSPDGKRVLMSRGIYNNDLILIRDTAKGTQQ